LYSTGQISSTTCRSSNQTDVERRLKAAYAMSSYKGAKAALHRVMDHLERLNPSAARSLAEGLEETLTLHRLGVPDSLRTSRAM
jgi:putative transposase